MPALLEGEYLGMVRGSLGSTRGKGIRSVLRVLVCTWEFRYILASNMDLGLVQRKRPCPQKIAAKWTIEWQEGFAGLLRLLGTCLRSCWEPVTEPGIESRMARSPWCCTRLVLLTTALLAEGRCPQVLFFCAIVMVNVDFCVIFLILPTRSSGTGAQDDVSF